MKTNWNPSKKRIALIEEIWISLIFLTYPKLPKIFLFSQSDAIYLQSASNEYGLATKGRL